MKEELERLYDNTMAELESAREKYAEAAVSVTRLTEIANTLRNMIDS